MVGHDGKPLTTVAPHSRDILGELSGNVTILLIDEAPCISTGPDPRVSTTTLSRYFKPDYFGGFTFEPSHSLKPSQQTLIDWRSETPTGDLEQAHGLVAVADQAAAF